jgi:hypothetical protein
LEHLSNNKAHCKSYRKLGDLSVLGIKENMRIIFLLELALTPKKEHEKG